MLGTSNCANYSTWNPKTQCKVCLSYWDIGIVYCTCGHFLRKGREENQKFIQYEMDLLFLTTTCYYINKGRPHGHRYGKKPGDEEYCFANQLKKFKKVLSRVSTMDSCEMTNSTEIRFHLDEPKIFVAKSMVLRTKIIPTTWLHKKFVITKVIGEFVRTRLGSDTMPIRHRSVFQQALSAFPDAGEAINDFWSMSGNFIYRHHVEPRVKLFPPREESFFVPLQYIDASRTTHTFLDVKQEKRIDDYWNIDGSRNLSDPWAGFERFALLGEGRRVAPGGCVWSGGDWRESGLHPDQIIYGQNSGNQWESTPSWRKSRSGLMKSSILKTLEKFRGIYFIDPEDTKFKETIKNARKKLETSVVPAMPC